VELAPLILHSSSLARQSLDALDVESQPTNGEIESELNALLSAMSETTQAS
jgi:hypothetical protein